MERAKSYHKSSQYSILWTSYKVQQYVTLVMTCVLPEMGWDGNKTSKVFVFIAVWYVEYSCNNRGDVDNYKCIECMARMV